MKDAQKLIERIKTETRGIETTPLENVVANVCLPLYLVAQTFQNQKYSAEELYNLNVLGYKRLLKIQERNNGHLPTKIRNMYLTMPCGIAKLCASGMRNYLSSAN
jgi:hypothetical protein